MRDVRTVVQFIHPGLEHGSDPHSDVRSWNNKRHRRKFLRTPGRIHQDGEEQDRTLMFWGEWEAASRVVARFPQSTDGRPRFLHQPLAPKTPEVLDNLQNTDPYVFGDQFLYTCCQQFTKKGPTQLRYLAPGSLILFGSYLGSRFVMDTAFVTARSIDHAPSDNPGVIEAATSHDYRLATVERIYASDRARPVHYRLYFGATPRERVDEMFSFFPCAAADSEPFARPEIKLRDFVNPALKQGYKIHQREMSSHEIKRLWEETRQKVLDRGLSLGTFAAAPEPERARGADSR